MVAWDAAAKRRRRRQLTGVVSGAARGQVGVASCLHPSTDLRALECLGRQQEQGSLWVERHRAGIPFGMAPPARSRPVHRRSTERRRGGAPGWPQRRSPIDRQQSTALIAIIAHASRLADERASTSGRVPTGGLRLKCRGERTSPHGTGALFFLTSLPPLDRRHSYGQHVVESGDRPLSNPHHLCSIVRVDGCGLDNDIILSRRKYHNLKALERWQTGKMKKPTRLTCTLGEEGTRGSFDPFVNGRIKFRVVSHAERMPPIRDFRKWGVRRTAAFVRVGVVTGHSAFSSEAGASATTKQIPLAPMRLTTEQSTATKAILAPSQKLRK